MNPFTGELGRLLGWCAAVFSLLPISTRAGTVVLSLAEISLLTGETRPMRVFPFTIRGWGGGGGDATGTGENRSDFAQQVNTPRFEMVTNGWEFPWSWNATGQSTEAQARLNLMNTIRRNAGTVGVACGEKHTLLLKQDGTVEAVGSSQSGQANVPLGLNSVIAIAAGSDHSLALKADSTVVAWGWNTAGQTDVPRALKGVTAIAAGREFSLALLENGTVRAWGGGAHSNGDADPADPDDDDDDEAGGDYAPPESCREPGASAVIAVAAGARHALALRIDGSITGWGAMKDQLAWTLPADLGPVKAIAAGSGFSVALTATGKVRAWGDDHFSKLNVPPNLDRVVALACGNYHTVALREDGRVVVWGSDDSGQLSVPKDLEGVVAISAGGFHSEAATQRWPLMGSPRLQSGKFSSELNLPAGRRYRFETSTNLSTWKSSGPIIAFPIASKIWYYDGTAASNFYRIVAVSYGEP